MKQHAEAKKPGAGERLTYSAMQFAGSTKALIAASSLIIIWGIAGPVLRFSENWLLAVNTFTSIVTFLMVFLIQKAHNKDSLAIQLKLNELLAAHESASNKLVNAEHMAEDELKIIQEDYFRLSEKTKTKANETKKNASGTKSA